MQRAEFVQRTPHPADRRATLVALTPKATSLLSTWADERGAGTAHLLGGTSPDDLAVFAKVLDRVAASLRTLADGTP